MLGTIDNNNKLVFQNIDGLSLFYCLVKIVLPLTENAWNLFLIYSLFTEVKILGTKLVRIISKIKKLNN